MKLTALIAISSAVFLAACGPNPQPVVYTQPAQPTIVTQQPGFVNGQPVIVQQGGMSAGEGALLGAGAGFLAGRLSNGGYGSNTNTHTHTTIIERSAPTVIQSPAATSGRVLPQQAATRPSVTTGPSFRQAQSFTVTKSTSPTPTRVNTQQRRR